jgi:hypothetical protein
MPILLAIGGMLATFVASYVGRVLLALGMTFVAFAGTDIAMNSVEQLIQNNINGLPASLVSFLGWCWVDKAISLLFSTYSVCVAFKLAGSTVIKKLVMK